MALSSTAAGALGRAVKKAGQRGAALAAGLPAAHNWFGHVDMAPQDPILGVTEKWRAEPNPNKINLGVGAYRDDQGRPVVLDVVRKAEEIVAGSNEMEYLPIGGLRSFVERAVKLAHGPELDMSRVAAVQTLSGTGACRLMAEMVARYLPGSPMLVPDPTWNNHHNICKDAGVPVVKYSYYKPETKGLDFEALMEDLQAAPEGAVVLLHSCGHNPSGVDPTLEQWAQISALMKKNGLLPFFDSAYQGFATGDCDRDAAAVRLFVEDGHTVALAQSFAKNMGLYGQRVGAVSVVCSDKDEAAAVESQLKAIARPMYSNPPLHGALLVSTILGDEELRQQWYKEVKGMSDRISSMRQLLRSNLEALGSPLPWDHITTQIGMFAFTGLSPEQVDRLMSQHSIYLTRNGRISIAGVTTANVERLAKAIHEVTST